MALTSTQVFRPRGDLHTPLLGSEVEGKYHVNCGVGKHIDLLLAEEISIC